MQIIKFSDENNRHAFAVKKIIKANDTNFAVIKPFEREYQIKISRADYQSALTVYGEFKKVSCYPIDGVLNGDTFEKGNYQMEII